MTAHVRLPASPFRVDVLRGERGKREGEWVESDELPNGCPHGSGLTCRMCDREAEAEEATWD